MNRDLFEAALAAADSRIIELERRLAEAREREKALQGQLAQSARPRHFGDGEIVVFPSVARQGMISEEARKAIEHWNPQYYAPNHVQKVLARVKRQRMMAGLTETAIQADLADLERVLCAEINRQWNARQSPKGSDGNGGGHAA